MPHRAWTIVSRACVSGFLAILMAALGVGVPAGEHAAQPPGATAQTTGLADVAGIAARWRHSLALKNDGTLWAWGDNTSGQLGNETTAFAMSSVPVQVTGLSGVTNAAVGGDHSLAVTGDGTVWAWGGNAVGQLGDETTINRSAPVRVSGLTNVPGGVRAVAAGLQFSVALKNDGTVWAWGVNDAGQLGDGTTTNRTSPVQVSGLTDVAAIVAGTGHVLALKNDGTVWAWGANDEGQLGDGTTTSRSTPVQVSGGMVGVTALAAGVAHSLAVKNDGTVWAWGMNDSGQLGDGTTTSRSTPVQVSGGMTDVRSIAAGSYHSLAAKSDGTVWAWGEDDYGQLGDGVRLPSAATTPVPAAIGPVGSATPAARTSTTPGTTTATATATSTRPPATPTRLPSAMSSPTNRNQPVQVTGGLSQVVEVAAGEQHSLALKSDGSVWAWGGDREGQLGDGCLADRCVDRSTPVQVVAGLPSVGYRPGRDQE